MIVGKVGEWIARLPKGKAVILNNDDIRDSAKAYFDSNFDSVWREDILKVVSEVNSDEYPGFEMWERPDGRWTLENGGSDMKNKIDILIDRLRDAIQTGDGSSDCQNNINDKVLLVVEEINKILKTCKRDLR